MMDTDGDVRADYIDCSNASTSEMLCNLYTGDMLLF